MKQVFFDTNILLYAAAAGDTRTETARTLLQKGGWISVQVLNEFVNVHRHKLKTPWEELRPLLSILSKLCEPVLALDERVHELALDIAERHNFHIYHACIIASALEAGCTTLYTEDMQNGQQIGALTIRNPFRN